MLLIITSVLVLFRSDCCREQWEVKIDYLKEVEDDPIYYKKLKN